MSDYYEVSEETRRQLVQLMGKQGRQQAGQPSSAPPDQHIALIKINDQHTGTLGTSGLNYWRATARSLKYDYSWQDFDQPAYAVSAGSALETDQVYVGIRSAIADADSPDTSWGKLPVYAIAAQSAQVNAAGFRTEYIPAVVMNPGATQIMPMTPLSEGFNSGCLSLNGDAISTTQSGIHLIGAQVWCYSFGFVPDFTFSVGLWCETAISGFFPLTCPTRYQWNYVHATGAGSGFTFTTTSTLHQVLATSPPSPLDICSCQIQYQTDGALNNLQVAGAKIWAVKVR